MLTARSLSPIKTPWQSLPPPDMEYMRLYLIRSFEFLEYASWLCESHYLAKRKIIRDSPSAGYSLMVLSLLPIRTHYSRCHHSPQARQYYILVHGSKEDVLCLIAGVTIRINSSGDTMRHSGIIMKYPSSGLYHNLDEWALFPEFAIPQFSP